MRSKILPLGIDIGSSRARVAVAERARNGDVHVRAVASRDLPHAERELQSQLVAALIEEMLGEIGVKERRCIASVGSPNAEMRVMRFPKMSWTERLQAAAFEAQRFATWDLAAEETTVRVHPHNRELGSYGVGIVRPEAMQGLLDVFKAARLSPIAVDFDACALRRAIPLGDAIIDIGLERSTLHTFAEDGPISYSLPVGGALVTRGISAELSIDAVAAERRKRILGCAGAGMLSRDELVVGLADGVALARGRRQINRIALVGNGSRLPGLPAGLEAATNAVVELPVSQLLETDAYPEDVLRAAAPDWTLAASLATWAAA